MIGHVCFSLVYIERTREEPNMQLSLISGREEGSMCRQSELQSLQKALPINKKNVGFAQQSDTLSSLLSLTL